MGGSPHLRMKSTRSPSLMIRISPGPGGIPPRTKLAQFASHTHTHTHLLSAPLVPFPYPHLSSTYPKPPTTKPLFLSRIPNQAPRCISVHIIKHSLCSCGPIKYSDVLTLSFVRSPRSRLRPRDQLSLHDAVPQLRLHARGPRQRRFARYPAGHVHAAAGRERLGQPPRRGRLRRRHRHSNGYSHAGRLVPERQRERLGFGRRPCRRPCGFCTAPAGRRGGREPRRVGRLDDASRPGTITVALPRIVFIRQSIYIAPSSRSTLSPHYGPLRLPL